jgi:uncharacterized protein
MADSLRDQLLALGLAKRAPEKPREERQGGQRPAQHAHKHGAQRPPQSRPDARPHATPQGKPQHKPQHKPQQKHGAQGDAPRRERTQEEIDLAQAYAQRARSEREEKARAEREAQQRAKEKRERRAKLVELLRDKTLNDTAADVARHFPFGEKIRRVYVTAEQLPRVNSGELGVVQLQGRYLLVERDVALQAQAIDADAIALLVDPGAPAEDDIPADLIW